MSFTRIATIFLFAMILGSNSFGEAHACLVDHPQDYKIFRTAEVILRARIINYTARPKEFRALFEFETVELISGRVSAVPKSWKAEWRNSTFGEPEIWKKSLNVIVGLGATIDMDGQPILFVVQQSCSLPSIIEDTPDNLRAIAEDAGLSLAKHNRQ